MNIREQELFYAALEGKFCSIDDDKDRGCFFMQMQTAHSGDTEYWTAFMTAYNTEENNEKTVDSGKNSRYIKPISSYTGRDGRPRIRAGLRHDQIDW